MPLFASPPQAAVTTRGSGSDDRLTMMPDGKIALALKTPWRDGTVGIVLTAIQLVAKLAPPFGLNAPSGPDHGTYRCLVSGA